MPALPVSTMIDIWKECMSIIKRICWYLFVSMSHFKHQQGARGLGTVFVQPMLQALPLGCSSIAQQVWADLIPAPVRHMVLLSRSTCIQA